MTYLEHLIQKADRLLMKRKGLEKILDGILIVYGQKKEYYTYYPEILKVDEKLGKVKENFLTIECKNEMDGRPVYSIVKEYIEKLRRF